MSISCDCSVDIDYGPEVAETTYPKARKEHICGECGETIKKGQKYENFRGLYEDRWSTHKTCMRCVALRDKYCPGGWIFGRVLERIGECMDWNPLTEWGAVQ